jgi:Secretion system C-terminal sorting domain/Beta-galactosidase
MKKCNNNYILKIGFRQFLFFILFCISFRGYNQRYLALTLTNDGSYTSSENTNDVDLIQWSKNLGMNAVNITVLWNYVNANPTTSWAKYDAQIQKAKDLNMKIYLKISMTTTCLQPDTIQCSNINLCANNIIKGHVANNDIRLHWGNGQRQNVHTSLSSTETIDRMKSFTQQVLQRYDARILDQTIAWVSVTTSWTQELGFEWQTFYGENTGYKVFLTDYSPSTIKGFQTWLENKYGNFNTMKSAWGNWAKQSNGSDATSFLNVYPPKPNNPNSTTDTEPFTSAFVVNVSAGKDWYTYRTLMLKNYAREFKNKVKSLYSTLKVINEHGSVFDRNTVVGGTFAFKRIAGFGTPDAVDGIKFNSGPGQDHRFSTDIQRSNSPTGTILMNEAELVEIGTNTGSYNYDDVQQQCEETFDRGVTIQTIKFNNIRSYDTNDPNRPKRELLGPKISSIVSTKLNSSYTIPISGSTNYTLGTIINNTGCWTTRNNYGGDCVAYVNYRGQVTGNTGGSTNITFDESDFLSTTNNTVSTSISCTPPPPSCNYSLTGGSQTGNVGESLTLNPNCTGSDCGGVSYTWVGNGQSGSGLSITLPSTVGTYSYTVKANKTNCSEKTANISITVTLSSCYKIESKSGVDKAFWVNNTSSWTSVVQKTFDPNDPKMRWKKIDLGGGFFKLESVENNINGIRAVNSTSIADWPVVHAGYNGDAYQKWKIEEIAGDPGYFKIINGQSPGNAAMQVDFANQGNDGAGINMAGSYSGGNHQKFKFTAISCNIVACNFTLADGNQNGVVGGSLTLNPDCTGSDCGGVSYTWVGNGQSGSGLNITLPSTVGTYSYTVKANKTNCSEKIATITVIVSAPCYKIESKSGIDKAFWINNTSSWTSVIQKTFDPNDPKMRWKKIDVGGGLFKLESVENSTNGIRAVSSTSIADWPVVHAGYSDESYKKWKIEALTGADQGYYKILNGQSPGNAAMQVDFANQGNDGAGITMAGSYYGGNHQKFKFTAIGCSAGSSRISAITTNESEEKEGIHIAPNPVNNILHYSYISEAESDEVQLQIFDMLGRSLKNIKQTKTGRITKGEISVEGFMQGSYILNANDGIKKFGKRFIKE